MPKLPPRPKAYDPATVGGGGAIADPADPHVTPGLSGGGIGGKAGGSGGARKAAMPRMSILQQAHDDIFKTVKDKDARDTALAINEGNEDDEEEGSVDIFRTRGGSLHRRKLERHIAGQTGGGATRPQAQAGSTGDGHLVGHSAGQSQSQSQHGAHPAGQSSSSSSSSAAAAAAAHHPIGTTQKGHHPMGSTQMGTVQGLPPAPTVFNFRSMQVCLCLFFVSCRASATNMARFSV